MKKKTIITTLMVCTLALGGATSAFASSQGTGNVLDQISVKIQEFMPGDTIPEMPENAQEMNKEIIEEVENADNISATVKEFKDGDDFPVIPKGAVQMKKIVN